MLGGAGDGASAYRHVSVRAGGERRMGVSAHRRVSVLRGGGDRRIGVWACIRGRIGVFGVGGWGGGVRKRRIGVSAYCSGRGGGGGRAIGVPAYRRTSVFAPLCMHAVPVEFPVLLYVQGSVGVLVQFGTSALSG